MSLRHKTFSVLSPYFIILYQVQLICRTPINLDYFEEAIDMLLNMKEIQQNKGVGLMAISKAGEVALAMTGFLPQHKISATCILNSGMNVFMQDVYYKDQKVLEGRNYFTFKSVR